MSVPEIPTAARTLLRRLDGWSVTGPLHATGEMEFGGLSETTDGNGKRTRIKRSEVVDSALIRACHVDGRALVALFVRCGPVSKRTGKKGWTLDMAWRGRHPGEHTPKPMTATQLAAYVEAPDARAGLVAVTANESEAA